MKPLPTPRVGERRWRRNMSSNGLLVDESSLSSSLSLISGVACVVSMFTTAGSTRRAISANDADSASGARAICTSGCATAGRPESIAPIPMPATKHATASAAIQMRSFRRIVRSCSELFLETSNIFHHLLNKPIPLRRRGATEEQSDTQGRLEYSERVAGEQKTGAYGRKR